MSTILTTAYAVNPFKGSEDGIAWNIIKQMASHNKVIAITRENNQEPIEKYLKSNPLPEGSELEFFYFDLPFWMRFWKKGGRGALLYHYLWHLSVVFFIKKQKFSFDIAHHLNFNNDWTPSFLWMLKKPFVWGPIGHHPKIEYDYIKQYGTLAYLKEELKWMVKECFWKFDPFLKITKRKASKIIALNSSVQKVLGVSDEKIVVIPAAGNENPELPVQITNDHAWFTVLSVGRFVSLKGFDLTIEAFAKFYHQLSTKEQSKTRLVLIGKGEAKSFLEELINKNKLPKHAIQMINWVSRDVLSQYYADADVFIFPSHEGAGMVVPEALSYGLPVLCYDNVGPGELMGKDAGIAIPYTTYDLSIHDYAEALTKLFQDNLYRQELSINALNRFEQIFTWEQKGLQIQQVHQEIFDKLPHSKETPKLQTIGQLN